MLWETGRDIQSTLPSPAIDVTQQAVLSFPPVFHKLVRNLHNYSSFQHNNLREDFNWFWRYLCYIHSLPIIYADTICMLLSKPDANEGEIEFFSISFQCWNSHFNAQPLMHEEYVMTVRDEKSWSRNLAGKVGCGVGDDDTPEQIRSDLRRKGQQFWGAAFSFPKGDSTEIIIQDTSSHFDAAMPQESLSVHGNMRTMWFLYTSAILHVFAQK